MDDPTTMSLTCPACRRVLAPDAQVCDACGTPCSLGEIANNRLAPGSDQGSAAGDAVAYNHEKAAASVTGNALGPGTRLAKGRYRIEHSLGRGGFGAAYLACDTKLNRPCVIKLLQRPAQRSDRDRQRSQADFQREAEALVRLNDPGHPNIPEIYDYLDRPRCLVMKYIAGQSLAELRAKQAGPLPEPEALRYLRDVCSALVYMHGHTPEPVLHRDVKPSNILLDATGRIWLIDFGLARTFDTRSDANRGSPPALGTPGYTPLEQWRGKPVPRSDVYALAVTLRTLIAPPAPAGRSPISPELQQLLQRGLSDDVEQRPTAAEFQAGLEAILNRPSIPLALRPDHPPQLQGFIGREAELAVLAVKLKLGHCVAISGLAGVGKTSLAAMFARQVGGLAGTFWHTFHQHEKGERLLRTLAAFLAQHGQPNLFTLLQRPSRSGDPLTFDQTCNYVLDLLRGRSFLICLDDADLADSNEPVGQLIARLQTAARAGELQLVVTSRRIPPWARSGETMALAGLSDADARDLLQMRGVAISAELTDQILAYTEGNAKLLNLAIDVLQRHADPPNLIRALAETDDIAGYLIHQVHEGLTEEQDAVMGAVAVLLGYGGSRDAVEFILERDDCWDVLNSLRERFLLTASAEASEVEYVQHALVRMFYYRRLSHSRRRHYHRRAAAYYAAGERNTPKAIRHLIEARNQQRAAALIIARAEALIDQGQASELRQLIEQLRPQDVDGETWSLLCDAHGEAASLMGDYDTARAKFHEAFRYTAAPPNGVAQVVLQARRYRMLAVVEERTGAYKQAEADCHTGLARTLNLGEAGLETSRLYAQLATVLWRMSRLHAAEAACAAGLAALPPENTASRERAMIWHIQARIAIDRGQYLEAIGVLEQGLALARQLDDRPSIALMQYNLGTAYYHRGETEPSKACYQRCLAVRSELGDVVGRIEATNGLGLVHMASGEAGEAQQRFAESRQLCASLGIPAHQAMAALNLGQIHLERGQLEEALLYLDEARAIYTKLDKRLHMAHCLYLLGDLALLRCKPDQALDHAERAFALADELDSPSFASCALRVNGEARLALGQSSAADTKLAAAWRLQNRVGDPYDQALILAARAESALALGRPKLARTRARRALGLARRQHMAAQVARMEALLQDIDVRNAR